VFEDAGSIQTMVRQVVMLVLEGKVDNKKASTVLYALQIASSNLKRMEAEKPRPAQVVVDEEKVAETPLGMTPWSRKEGGHEIEDIAAGFQGDMAAQLKAELQGVREAYGWKVSGAHKMASEIEGYLRQTPPISEGDLRYFMRIMSHQ